MKRKPGQPLDLPLTAPASEYKAVEILREQHTAIHEVLHKFPRSGSREIIKHDIARIIAALANAQSIL